MPGRVEENRETSEKLRRGIKKASGNDPPEALLVKPGQGSHACPLLYAFVGVPV